MRIPIIVIPWSPVVHLFGRMLQLQGNKLIIEKLTIYDRIGIVKVVLASGFVGEAGEALLSPRPSGHLTPGDRCVV